jgi:hypothetical protein
MSQEQELEGMMQGIPVAPMMQDNHQEHVEILDAFEESDQFGQVTAEWVESIYKPHKQEHLRMNRVVQQQIQAQSAQGQGSRTQGQGNQGNFPGQEGIINPESGGGGGLGQNAAEAIGSTFTGGL